MKSAYETAQAFNLVDKYGKPLPEAIEAMKQYRADGIKRALKDAADNLKLKSFTCACKADGIHYMEGDKQSITETPIDKYLI